jgi:hypothetical protein
MLKRLVVAAAVCLVSVVSFRYGIHASKGKITAVRELRLQVPVAKSCVPEEDMIASPDCPCGCCYHCSDAMEFCPGCGDTDDSDYWRNCYDPGPWNAWCHGPGPWAD